MKKIGKYGEGFFITPKGNALYNARLALRYGDKDAQVKYMSEYFELGGTLKGLGQSLSNMHPLAGMSEKEQIAFVLTLDEDEKKKLVKASKFWGEVITDSVKK